ncbi:MAG: metal-sensing transcriptional repressor [Clostridia bacterium]|nr:metal-sensing transcriptional repressor [Clostridia bacterium]
MDCVCNQRKKTRSQEEYKSLLNRLNRMEGQIRGIKNMLENEAYCTDILVQTAAVKAAIDGFSKELLSNHIKTCVKNDLTSGNTETVDELVNTIYKVMK